MTTPTGPPPGPTGPPPGPGVPSGPPPGPSLPPTGGGPPATPSGGHRGLILVVIAVLVVAAVAGGVGFLLATRSTPTAVATPTPGGVIIYEPPDKTGDNPFTPRVDAQPAATTTPLATTSAAPRITAAPVGSTPTGTPLPSGTFGGSGANTVCDREKLLAYLHSDATKLRVWAQVRGIDPGQVDAYVRGLHPARLAADLRVTNHSYINGKGVDYQSILAQGSAVLVDDSGQVVTRCACGNPLSAAVPVGTARCVGCPGNGYTPPPVPKAGQTPEVSLAPVTPPPTPKPAAVTNLAPKARPSASSTSDGYPASLGIDGDPTTSWFSAGPSPVTHTSTFTLEFDQPVTVTRVEFVGNGQQANPDFRTGYGFGRWTIDLLDGAGHSLLAINSSGSGTTDQNADVPSIAGVSAVLFTGYDSQASDCGGFGELRVIGH
jgi:hypothetical protein